MGAILLALSGSPWARAAEKSAAGGAPRVALASAPAARHANKVVVITIKGEITGVTAFSVKRRLAAAQRAGADAVVFELDTPGGRADAALEICDTIKNSPIKNTVAWVNTEAYSAGAFIALACREIVVAESATMGDAGLIQIVFGVMPKSLGETERQKLTAPYLAELVDSARLRGYDEHLVQAFSILGVELWLVERTDTGEQRFVTEREWRMLFDADPPRGSPRVASGAPATGSGEDRTQPTASPPSGATADDEGGASKPGASTDERRRFSSASPALSEETVSQISDSLGRASARAPISEADRGKWRLVEYVTDGKTFLLLKTHDQIRYGLASAIVRNDEELKGYFGATTLIRRDATWSERLVVFFTNPIVRFSLIAILVIAIFAEMATPGIGIAAAIAALAGAALLAPPLLIGAAGWWTAVAVVAGVACIVGELVLFPGVIVLGAAGAILLMAGLVGSFVTGDSGDTGTEVAHGVALTLLAFFVAGVGIYFLSRFYGSIPVFNRLILSGAGEEPRSAGGAGMLAAMAREAPAPVRIGATGVAVTTLRPAGSAEFGGRMVDVVSELGFVDEGRAVRIVSVTPYRVGVEPVRDSPPEARS